MTTQDLEVEFRDTADFYFGMSKESYNEYFLSFLQGKCIQTENSHQIALNIALERVDKLEKAEARIIKLTSAFNRLAQSGVDAVKKIEKLNDQIEGLKRQIKA